MTTIVCAGGVMAADSRVTSEDTDSGTYFQNCETKLFRARTKDGVEAVIGLAGESASGMLFLAWYGTGKRAPAKLLDGEAGFEALVLKKDGLWSYDKWCVGERVAQPYTIGTGAKAALGALAMGADAKRAVEVAATIDPYTGGPIHTMTLQEDTP